LAVDIDKSAGDAQRMFRMDRTANPRPHAQRFEPSMEIVEELLADVPYQSLSGEESR